MKRIMKSVCGLMLLLLALVMVGCGSSTSSESESEPVTVVKVGAVLPLDGQWSSLGESAAVALELAVKSANHYLQKDNLQLELVVENSNSDADTALVALQSLHAKGVRAVIGPMTSDEAEAMVDYANANDMLLVSPSSTAVSLALPDNLFRMVPNDSNQVEALIDLMNSQNIITLLPVYLNDPYGRDFEELIRTDTSGIEVLEAITYEVDTTHLAPVVSSLESAVTALNPATTAILFIGRDSDAVEIFSGAGVSSSLANFKWFASDSIIRAAAIVNSAEAEAFAAKVNLEGYTFSSEATAPVVPTMMVTAMMADKLGTTPSPTTLGVWDALWFIAEAYRQNPDANAIKLIENFISVVNSGGTFSSQASKFDDNGDMIPVRYARFAVEEGDSGIRWNLKGMFVKSINVGKLTIPATASTTHEAGDVVIGVLLPLSGANAEKGFGAQQAINLALQHANDYYQKSLGVNVDFKVEVRDTAGDPATALEQLQVLHALGIELIIGPISSGELAAMRDYAVANGLVIISPTSTAPSLASSEDRIMRLTPDDTRQAKALSRLITAQNKEHVVLMYRDDVYGQDFVTAFSEIYEGSIDSYPYAPDTNNFSSVLDQTSSKLGEIGAPASTAVLVVGLDEVVLLLEQIKAGLLTEVSWYGTDGISQSRTLLASPVAMAMAEKTQLTCSTYDEAAATFFAPAIHVLESKLSPLLGGSSTWNELSAYDAMWISASAFAMTGPTAYANEIWTYIYNLFLTSGVYGVYIFNEQRDNIISLYTFYTPKETGTGPVWTATAYYRDSFAARDSLEIIGQ